MMLQLQIVAFVLEAFFSEMEISASEKSSEDDSSSSDSDNEVSIKCTSFRLISCLVRILEDYVISTTINFLFVVISKPKKGKEEGKRWHNL